MKELIYLEIPTPDRMAVVEWLQHYDLLPVGGSRQLTPDGFRIEGRGRILTLFTWSVLNTTYLKVFQWTPQGFDQQSSWLQQLTTRIREAFPHQFPQLPPIDLSQHSIFEALQPYYPLTAQFFQRIPNGEADLQRVYWWEKRWRAEVAGRSASPQDPVVVNNRDRQSDTAPEWDLVVVGGALGSLFAAIMAKLGYRVALVERLPFGRMNREWNISRRELQTLVDVGLFSPAEIESLILRQYQDGLNKFFDGNSPVKAPILHTPTVLNLAINAEQLLRLCGDKIIEAHGQIFDYTDFVKAEIGGRSVRIHCRHRDSLEDFTLSSRLLVDAMGTASPIAQQINQGKAFDSVCPTVGAVIKSGFAPGVWDSNLGDILASHGDISRGRQLIWELFPGPDQELTFYLFHYHQLHPDNPGSLLEMYEDFFAILPEYRRCDLDQLEWKKATFGYIPGHFSRHSKDRTVGFDRVLMVGDAAAMQSPLSFTGFGSLVRNLPRLADLLHIALQHNLVSQEDLQRVRAYQGNAAVTWLFSRGMMVPSGVALSPERINAMLNSFFGILAEETPEVADDFIKDRAGWIPFNRMALKAARSNPRILLWIWQAVGWQGIVEWLPTYFSYTLSALWAFLFAGWLPRILQTWQVQLESQSPRLWHRLWAWTYALTYGVGQPRLFFRLNPQPDPGSTLNDSTDLPTEPAPTGAEGVAEGVSG